MEEPDLRQQKLDNQVKEQLLRVLDAIRTWLRNVSRNNNGLETTYICVKR